MKDKRSFFERLTGTMHLDEEDEFPETTRTMRPLSVGEKTSPKMKELEPEVEPEGELAVDMYQTPDEIIIKAMVAGVDPNQVEISITSDMVTLRGRREENESVSGENYFHQELYWGSFSRTILLPQEIEPEEAVASEEHGMLTLVLPKVDKKKVHKVRVRSN